MKTEKAIGCLLLAGAIGVLVPYAILTATFNYPGILRQSPGTVLTEFHEGGAALILTWLSFALLGIPLLVAYSLLGQHLQAKRPYIGWVTTMGIISGVVQIIGLLRWVFVVPVLAAAYANAPTLATREAIEVSFQVVHQFGGVLLGEHLGQLFTVIWTTGMSAALLEAGVIPRWLAWFGYTASFIYFLAQAEVVATVIPGFPVLGVAGLLGSTLWLAWLVLLGARFLKG